MPWFAFDEASRRLDIRISQIFNESPYDLDIQMIRVAVGQMYGTIKAVDMPAYLTVEAGKIVDCSIEKTYFMSEEEVKQIADEDRSDSGKLRRVNIRLTAFCRALGKYTTGTLEKAGVIADFPLSKKLI